ncbi:hypothetical protein AVEN_168681-1 [Araneus ventricosus]|uniref:Uncharacterized protein n=1 Tax=Araneus ventricosus TaxID=182803 RepID=A0A4Y2WF05_ARAVE|nr:hypothetical protein AVEN_12177-1 [Araneus ventricosus]GBO36243.1 hypothetical protein AVEN_168681-1 [Araneus ventricosus]
MLFPEVEPCSLGSCLNPLEYLPKVFIHEKLLSFSSKKDQHPVLLKQLALEAPHWGQFGHSVMEWIPSHVYIFFNGLADELAKQGSAEPLDNRSLLTSNETFSKVRAITTGPGGSHLFRTGTNKNILGLP